MNTGVISNQGRDNWRTYYPRMLCAANGAVTHPTIAESNGVDQQRPFGRWTIDEDGLVTAEIQFAFVGSTTIGSGSAYVWSLPVPARRLLPGPVAYPIGTGLSYLSFTPAPNANVFCVPTLADPWSSLGGNENSYCQMIAPYVLSWGTATIASGSSSTTFNHRAGFAVAAQDVEIVAIDGDVGVASPYHFTGSIDSTQVQVQTRSNTTADHDLSWKIRAEPNASQAYVSPAVPFDWSRFTSLGPFANFFIQIGYEAA